MPPVIYKELLQRAFGCKANFWKGRTGTRAGLQECECATRHLPVLGVLAKWTATLPLNAETDFPQLPAQISMQPCFEGENYSAASHFCSRDHHSSFSHLSVCEPYKNIPVCISVHCMPFSKLMRCGSNGYLLSQLVYDFHKVNMVCVNSLK